MFQVRTQRPWRRPWWTQFTWRTVLCALAAGSVLVYPVYCVLDAAITHGIHERDGLLHVDMQAMSAFPIDQATGTDNDIPICYRQLDGKRVELHGEMWNSVSTGGMVSKFNLVYSVATCCYGGPPRIQCFVKSTMANGQQVEYRHGRMSAIGILHVGVEKTAGQITSVYRLDVQSVE